MRRPILTTGALLLLASSVLADLKIVGEMKLPANRLVRLEAEGAAEGAALIWDVSNEESVDAEEVGQRFLFAAPPGSYKIKLRSIRLKDGKTTVETARAVVVIGDAPPMPPVPPGPGPGPAPADPLAVSVGTAYSQESDAGKSAQVVYLALVYRSAGPLVDASTTTSDLFTKLSAAIHAPGVGLPAGALPKVSRAVGDYLNTELGTSPTAALDKAKTKAALVRVADALGGLK